MLLLTPDVYPANASTLKSAHEMLKIGHQDLIDAHHDAQKIIQGLHQNKNELNSSSSGEVNHFKSSNPHQSGK